MSMRQTIILKKIILFFFIIVFISTNILASEKNNFLSLKNEKVNVRHGPDFKYPVKFFYKKKFYPVKIIDNFGNFKKIIDINNNVGWIHNSQLSKKKTAININNESYLFEKPKVFSKPLAKLEKGKLVIVKRCKNNWCKILANNFSGWIRKNNLWGRL